MRVKVIILAAGQGKRFGSASPKVLAEVGGKPMIAWVVEAVEKSNVTDRPVVVVGVGAEQVKAALGDRCDYVLQEQQLGTGHAVAQCRSLLEGKADAVLVLYGDMPLITTATIRRLVQEQERHRPTITLATATVPDFKDWRHSFANFGRIFRDRGFLWAVVEAKDATPDLFEVKEVNPGYYCFDSSWLWEYVVNLSNKNVQSEYYLTDLVAVAILENRAVNTISISPHEALGANSPEDLAILNQFVERNPDLNSS